MIARRWIDQDRVDVVADVPNSAAALAVSEVARDKKRIFLNSGAGTADLTGARCSPYTDYGDDPRQILTQGRLRPGMRADAEAAARMVEARVAY